MLTRITDPDLQRRVDATLAECREKIAEDRYGTPEVVRSSNGLVNGSWECKQHQSVYKADCEFCVEAHLRNNRPIGPAGDTYAISMDQAQALCGHEKTMFPQVCATGACWVPPTPARKDDAGKPDMSLVTYSMVEPAAKILKFGEKKYGRFNFRNPNPGFEQRLVAGILRHLLQHTDGQELDTESGEPHLAHALASLMLIFDRRAHKKEGEEL
jgi:hypothetical protein